MLVAAFVVSVPLAWANHTFGDVPASSPHHDDITLMKTANITAGCNPPASTLYCPDQFVRRDQMASFLARALGLVVRPNEVALGPVPGSQADKLDGLDASAFGVRMLKSPRQVSDTCGVVGTWNECAVINVTVPEGKTYRAVIIARASMFEINTENHVLFCASARPAGAAGANCSGEESGLILMPDDMERVEHTTWTTLTAGNWLLSSAINPSNNLNYRADFDRAYVQTTALRFDAAVPMPAAAVAAATAPGR